MTNGQTDTRQDIQTGTSSQLRHGMKRSPYLSSHTKTKTHNRHPEKVKISLDWSQTLSNNNDRI